MLNCPICLKEMKNKRALHAHMLKAHITEYREKECKLANFCIADESCVTPDSFRPLNRSDENENEAYLEGFRYIVDDTIYTSAECKEKGWL